MTKNLKKFFLSLLKKGGIGLASALLLPAMVLAVTTIGSNVTTDGHVLPGSNNTSDLGAFGTAVRDIYASGTLRSTVLFNSGNVNASGTSYFSHTVAAGNNIWDLGSGTSSWRNVYASGTIQLGTNILSATNNTSDLGVFGNAFNDVLASGTIYGATIFNSGNVNASGTSYLSHTVPANNNAWDLGSGTSSWRNINASGTLAIGGTGTSTLLGTLSLQKVAATSSFQVGTSLNTTNGQGGCIALKDSDGTGFIYLYYDSTVSSGLGTSTSAKVCY